MGGNQKVRLARPTVAVLQGVLSITIFIFIFLLILFMISSVSKLLLLF